MLRRGVRPLVFGLAFALLGCSVVDPRVEKRWAKIRDATITLDEEARFPTIPPVLPVVFLPGSKGTILRHPDCKGKTFWGNTRVLVLSKLDDLTIPLPKDETFSVDRFNRHIQPCGILGGVELLPSWIPFLSTFEYPIYRGFAQVLEKAGGFVPNESIFYFDYDWRLDNRVAAIELAALLGFYRKAYYKKYLEAKYCVGWQPDLEQCLGKIRLKWPHLFSLDGEIKFNFVTHSMGGLVAQYLVRGLGYGDDVQTLMLIASPTEGAMFPLQIMVEGEFAFGDIVFHFYQKKQTRPIGLSFPSAFQALPRYPDSVRSDPRSRFAYAGGYTREALGLTDEMPFDDGEREPWARAVATAWASLLDLDDPSWALICRISGEAHPSPECRRRILLHLAHEVQSSVSFQRTTNDSFCGARRGNEKELWARQRFEGRLLREAKAILKKIRPPRDGIEARQWIDAIEAVEHQSCSASVERGRRHVRLPHSIHQWFGHCDLTPTFAVASREADRDRLDFCEAQDPEHDACHDYGDKRIPRVSMFALGRLGGRPSEVVLCVGHVDVVKNLIVQDNLLMILFRERFEPLPDR